MSNQRNHNLFHFPLELRQARTLSSSVTLATFIRTLLGEKWLSSVDSIWNCSHSFRIPSQTSSFAEHLGNFVQYFMKWLAQIQSKIWNSSNCTSFIRLPGLNMLMFSKNVLTSFSNTFLTLEIKIKLHFSFHTSLWCRKRFYEDL